MADVNEKLTALQTLFGDDLETLGESGVRSATIDDVYQSLKIMFSVTDEDLVLKDYKGNKNAVRAQAQSPYLAMAHLLVALVNPVTPE